VGIRGVEYQYSTWIWFVRNIFNGDEECIALLQEWFGYNLIASNHMQAMMFFFGVPGSGKSTTGNILRAVLGEARSCAAETENFTTLFGKESLLNKYAAIMSESRGTSKADIDRLLQTWKALTGGDALNIARKYKSAVDARLFCRLTYIANEAIPFDDASQAMANRMNLLYFPNNYRKGKPDWDLENKLRAEVPGIALWAIEGLKRLLAAGQFSRPKISMEHLASLAELTNPIGTMLAECCCIHVGPEFVKHRTSCSDLYDLWNAWCDVNHVRTSLNNIGFGMKLNNMDRPIVKRQIMEAGKRTYVYQGLEILPEAYSRYLKR
jgi:P4 family phage/plasmid primase-like protien